MKRPGPVHPDTEQTAGLSIQHLTTQQCLSAQAFGHHGGSTMEAPQGLGLEPRAPGEPVCKLLAGEQTPLDT